MEVLDEFERATTRANTEAVSKVIVMGLAAICNELARLGALDIAAVTRIKEFMLIGAERSAATEKLRMAMCEAIDGEFLGLTERMETGLGRPSSRQ